MPNQKIAPEEAKSIILDKINSGIDFRTLRKELKGISRRNIKLLILEIVDELKLQEVPFPGLLRKPMKSTPPLSVSSDGTINVKELLEQKGFNPEACFAKYSVGTKKITMTIKEKKDNNVRANS
jgi:hypothetical protein